MEGGYGSKSRSACSLIGRTAAVQYGNTGSRPRLCDISKEANQAEVTFLCQSLLRYISTVITEPSQHFQ